MISRKLFALLPLLLILVYVPVESNGLESNEDYIFTSEKYSFVIGLDDFNNVVPVEGKIFYNNEWQTFNMTDAKVRVLDKKADMVWIEEGKLNNSTDLFWITWNLALDKQKRITGVWIYDGENLIQETDYNTQLTKIIL